MVAFKPAMRANPPSASSHAAVNAPSTAATASTASSVAKPAALDNLFGAMLTMLAQAEASEAAPGHGSSSGNAKRESDRPASDGGGSPTGDAGAAGTGAAITLPAPLTIAAVPAAAVPAPPVPPAVPDVPVSAVSAPPPAAPPDIVENGSSSPATASAQAPLAPPSGSALPRGPAAALDKAGANGPMGLQTLDHQAVSPALPPTITPTVNGDAGKLAPRWVSADRRGVASQRSAAAPGNEPLTTDTAGINGIGDGTAAVQSLKAPPVGAFSAAVAPVPGDDGGLTAPVPQQASVAQNPAAGPSDAAFAAAAPPLVRVAFIPGASDPEPAPGPQNGNAASAEIKPPPAAQSILAAAIDASEAAAGGQSGKRTAAHSDDPSMLPVAGNPPAAPAEAIRDTQAPASGTNVQTIAGPIAQVQAALRQAAGDRSDRIDIHLQPESLGAIEVRLHLFDDGSVSAHVAAERPETLHLLAADARQLEQSLRDSGLQAQAGCLSFSLRGDTNQPQGRAARDNGRASRVAAVAALPPVGAVSAAGLAGQAVRAGAIDIRI